MSFLELKSSIGKTVSLSYQKNAKIQLTAIRVQPQIFLSRSVWGSAREFVCKIMISAKASANT
jgi:hypothetical protein